MVALICCCIGGRVFDVGKVRDVHERVRGSSRQPGDFRCRSDDCCCRSDEGHCRSDEGHCRSDDGRCRSDDGRCRSDDGRCRSDDGHCCRSSDNQCTGNGLGWLGVGVLLSGGLLHVLQVLVSLGLGKRFYSSGMVVQKLVSNVPTILINNIHWLQKEYPNLAFRMSKIKDFIRSTELSFYKI